MGLSKRNKFYDEINSILIAWNPIGVPDDIASVEYKQYVPKIFDTLMGNGNLFNLLCDIITEEIGLEFDVLNENHVKDLKSVCSKIESLKHNEIDD